MNYIEEAYMKNNDTTCIFKMKSGEFILLGASQKINIDRCTLFNYYTKIQENNVVRLLVNIHNNMINKQYLNIEEEDAVLAKYYIDSIIYFEDDKNVNIHSRFNLEMNI